MSEEVKTLDVRSCDGWELVCAFNALGCRVLNVAGSLIDLIMNETWKLQDGYGEQGYTPPQGWDWSGIRDSSDEARADMGGRIRQLLQTFQVDEVRVQYRF